MKRDIHSSSFSVIRVAMTALPFPEVADISLLYMCDDIYDFLGEGSFATVLKAVSLHKRGPVQENQQVALKMIARKSLVSDKHIRDVINEVEVLRHTNHPNCVRFIECFQTSHHVVIVTDYIEGKDLFEFLKGQVFSEAIVRDVMQQLLHALAYLHDTLYVVHRDVKPENIMLATEEVPVRVVLVDFGLARSCKRQRPRLPRDFVSHFQMPHGMVRSSSIDSFECDSPMLSTPCGTLKYAAPETVQSITQCAQLSTTKDLLPRLDIYAAGIIMYVMLSGILPFKSTVSKAQLVKEMKAELNFTDQRWSSISDDAVEVTKALLSFDPAQRPRAQEALQYAWFTPDGEIVPPNPQTSMTTLPCSALDSSISDRGAMTHAFEAMRAPEAEMYFCEELQSGGQRPMPNGRCVSVPFGSSTTTSCGGNREAGMKYFNFIS